jgi:acetyl esterase/lipase
MTQSTVIEFKASRTKPLLFAACFVFACANLLAQRPGWQPSPGHTQVPIWPGNAPDAEFGPPANTETAVTPKSPVAGRPWLAVENVSRPTMTVYAPKGKNTGVAVVVFPGGGYNVLAIDLEAPRSEWLTSKGITSVLLKYRVPDSGPRWDGQRQINPKATTALQDAQRTMGLLRLHAGIIDPHKIGVLGFQQEAPGG